MSATERVTCPVCGRPDRALTKTGKIRGHDLPLGAIGFRTRGCPADGLTMNEATNLEDPR